MWKYLVVNTFWFSLLFLVHFFGSKKDRWIILISFFTVACILAMKGTMDPIAWTYYVAFSLLVYAGASNFRYWSFAQLLRMKEDLRTGGEQLGIQTERLRQKSEQTDFLETKADEIVEFYEQIKEMSKSLELLETFLIFTEALSEYFTFEVAKLALFSQMLPESRYPEELYELKGADFKGVFDRSAYLKDKKKTQGEVFPFDEKIYADLFEARQPVVEDSFTAYPVILNEKVFAVVSLVGIETKGDPLLHILIDRFISELQRVKLYERVEMLAITDGLTGVYVRRHLMERLEGELDRTKHFNLKFSLLMIDVDHFKMVNDQHGHLVGDVVLKQVAQSIKKNVREVDFTGRYGGEEFAVGLIETDEPTALLVAERIRKSIESREYKAYGENLMISVSIGCATYTPMLNSVNQLVDTADEALYRAKRLGRNRVCAAS